MEKLFELCRWNARHIIDDGHGDTLSDKNVIIKILADSLQGLDKLNGVSSLSKKVYLDIASRHNELYFLRQQIYFLSRTYRNINTDKDISFSEKVDISETL